MKALTPPISDTTYIKGYHCTGCINEVFDNIHGTQVSDDNSFLWDDSLALYCALQEIKSGGAYNVAVVSAEWIDQLAERYGNDPASLLALLSNASINYLILEYAEDDLTMHTACFFRKLQDMKKMETFRESDYVISDEQYNIIIVTL